MSTRFLRLTLNVEAILIWFLNAKFSSTRDTHGGGYFDETAGNFCMCLGGTCLFTFHDCFFRIYASLERSRLGTTSIPDINHTVLLMLECYVLKLIYRNTPCINAILQHNCRITIPDVASVTVVPLWHHHTAQNDISRDFLMSTNTMLSTNCCNKLLIARTKHVECHGIK
jgi:hypothetical protein